MTLRLEATVSCNGADCVNRLVVDEDNLHAREANLVAGDLGWKRDTKGNHLCPPCVAAGAEWPEDM